jgi:uncharacterized protein YcbK (DUF882 family)
MTRNFSKREFDCADGSEMPIDVEMNVALLAEQLQILRDYFNAPIRINSAYRSPSYNEAVGGSKNSQHMKGRAADIVVEGYTPDEVADTIDKLIFNGIMKEGGLGRYNNFTHYDIRGYRARWNYKIV